MGEGRVSLTPCEDFYRPVEELEYTDTFFLVMITSLRWWNTLNNKISKECVQRERKRQRDTPFFKKNLKKSKK